MQESVRERKACCKVSELSFIQYAIELRMVEGRGMYMSIMYAVPDELCLGT